MKDYEKQRNIVAAHLKSDNVKEVLRNTEVKARTTIVLKDGDPLVYYGEWQPTFIDSFLRSDIARMRCKVSYHDSK
jgi:hypothetical protein